MSLTNHQVRLAARPQGMIDDSIWDIGDAPVAEPDDGQVVVENLSLSLDPAMRGWLNDVRSYVPPVGIGEVMRAGGVGRVVESRDDRFPEGVHVTGITGVQEYATLPGDGLRSVDLGVAPPERWLGALGMPGMTAYFGLLEVGAAREGDTVVVSGAAGAVGSTVGQIAKLKGCRVIGIAGGPEKCAWLVDELGFDGAVDYRSERVSRRLRELCPDGVDVFFDNVGGEILEAGLSNLAMHARVVICGAISTYNAETPPPGPRNYMQLLVRRSRMEGFLVFDFLDRFDEAMAELVPAVGDGRIKHREDVRDGLESAPP